MHEMALTDKVLKIILTEAEAHQAQRIKKIRITVGDLSGIVNDSVKMYFELVAKGTIAEGAVLEFTRQKAILFCEQCQAEFTKEPWDFLCPRCNSLGKLTDIGRECLVQSIEVE